MSFFIQAYRHGITTMKKTIEYAQVKYLYANNDTAPDS
jgi:hypothetical protein